jgi:hypothetical protein
MTRRGRRSAVRLGLAAGATAAACALVWSSGVTAAPETGVVDAPGTPPGVLRITSPAGPVAGKISFCVEKIRVDTAAGPVAQSFMLKFDDFGGFGIGPYTPDANGSYCGTVSTIAADYTNARGGAADKLPDDLCDAAKPHTLRLLSAGWGAPGTTPEASQRSIAQPISTGGTCGGATPGGPGGGQTGPGGTTTGPATTTPGGSNPGTAVASLSLRSTTASVRGRSIYVRVPGGRTFVKGTAVLRTRDKVAMGRSKAVRWTLAKQSFQVAAGNTVELKLALTPNGRKLMRPRLRLAGKLTLTPVSGIALTREVSVRRPKASKN